MHVLAAMAPCTRLYGYIGCQLARAHKGGAGGGGRRRPPHPYSHWIRTYSAPAYLRLPAAKERIIDQLGADVPYGVLALCSAFVHLGIPCPWAQQHCNVSCGYSWEPRLCSSCSA